MRYQVLQTASSSGYNTLNFVYSLICKVNMDPGQNAMQVNYKFEQSLEVNLLSSLSELYENLRIHFESSSEQGHNLQDILNDALPHSLSSCVENIISNELESMVMKEVNEAGMISQQTWKIVAHNIFKTIKDSPQMCKVADHIDNFLERRLGTMEFSEKLSFNVESLSQPRQIKQFAKDVNTERPIAIRKQELKMLLHTQLPPTTIILHECWSQICQYLCNTLTDVNLEIFLLSLKIHARFASSPTILVIKESVLNLMHGFSAYYTQNMTQFPSCNGGSDNINNRLFRLGHLILFVLKKISLNVVKISEELEEILTCFFALLSMNSTDEAIISPYIVIAILDPHAAWFTNLLHGLISRNLVLSIISKSCLIEYIVNHVIFWGKHRSNRMSYASLSHSVSMFCALVKFKNGQSLFPLTMKTVDEPVTLEFIYVQLVNYLNINAEDELMQQMLKNSILNPIINTRILKSDSPLMRAILEPLPTNVPQHAADVLEIIVQSSVGVGCLLGAHDAKTLIDYTGMALQNHVKCNEEIKLTLVRTCGKLFENHRGFSQLEYSPLVTKAIYQYEILTSQNDTSPLHTALFRFLLSIGSTPLGLLSLSIHNDLLEYLMECCKEQDSEATHRCLAIAAILKDSQTVKPQALIRGLQCNNCRTKSVSSTATSHETSELSKFLHTSRDSPHDTNWRCNLQKTYKTSAHQNITPQALYDLVDQLSCSKMPPPIQPLSKITLPTANISEEVQWIIRYGEQHHLLQPGVPKYAEKLIHTCSLFHADHKDGFDWFLGISFLICAGNVERCCSFVAKVSAFPMAAILWPAICKHQSKRSNFVFGHKLELIIDEELPVAARILRMGRVCWWTTCRRWIAQHFLNVLEWEQICHWLALVFISQSEESCIYFCISLLKYMLPSILMAYNDNTLLEYLSGPISGFRTSDFINFINKLTKNYCNLKL